jgi:uncharacterized protein YndB with AHSA1/START domain/mannose-6-phosphate isomerase-like protein (cupin superfamily)
MAKAGDVLQIPALGIEVKLLRTAAETGGRLLEIEVTGRPRGLLTQEHVHVSQAERHEVVNGALKLVLAGSEHVLSPGESMVVAPGTPHRQLPAGAGPGHVRIEVRPAGGTQQFIERLAALSRAGEINRFGLPGPVAAAKLVRDFGAEGRATKPPAAVQRALSRAVLGCAALMRHYVFVDEWDVAAPPQAVFDALADARTYPAWWQPVYLDVDADGPPHLGKESRQHFKGRLPYHLHTRSRIVELDPPRSIAAEVEGDLRGRGAWTLTPTAAGTHVRFDWRVHADRRLLRFLTPVLRPALRWNHNWAIARAIDGLEPYARSTAAAGA